MIMRLSQFVRRSDTQKEASGRLDATVVENPTTVLLVEHRDEVFLQLVSNLATLGVRVVWAAHATEAIRRYVHCPTDLLIVSGDLPDESAWLLTAKLHLTHPAARTWVYMRRLSDLDVSSANFLKVDELIDHEDDWEALAAGITDRLRDSAGAIPVVGGKPEQVAPAEGVV